MKKTIVSLLTIGVVTVGSANATTTSENNAAQYLAERGIINEYEYGSSRYNLDRMILRQEAIGIARVMSGVEKKQTCDGLFADVSEMWVCQSAEAMREAGRIAPNTYFNPKRSVSKAEALALSVTANCNAEYETFRKGIEFSMTEEKSSFDDLYAFVREKGVIDMSYFSGNQEATRGEMFEMSEKMMKECTTINQEEIDKNIILDYYSEITSRNFKKAYNMKYESSISLDEFINLYDDTIIEVLDINEENGEYKVKSILYDSSNASGLGLPVAGERYEATFKIYDSKLKTVSSRQLLENRENEVRYGDMTAYTIWTPETITLYLENKGSKIKIVSIDANDNVPTFKNIKFSDIGDEIVYEIHENPVIKTYIYNIAGNSIKYNG